MALNELIFYFVWIPLTSSKSKDELYDMIALACNSFNYFCYTLTPAIDWGTAAEHLPNDQEVVGLNLVGFC